MLTNFDKFSEQQHQLDNTLNDLEHKYLWKQESCEAVVVKEILPNVLYFSQVSSDIEESSAYYLVDLHVVYAIHIIFSA